MKELFGVARHVTVTRSRGIAVAVLLVVAWPADGTAATPLTLDRPVHADSGLGEPQIALNPLDPADIAVGENDTGVSVSRDGGSSWARVALPNPGDNALAVGPDGRFVYTALDGDVRVSRDGGRSWQTAGNWVGAVAAQAHAAAPTGATAFPGRELGCNAPEPEGPVSADPEEGPGPQLIGCDRPWLQADPATGTLYVSFTAHDDASGGEGARGWELALLACRTTVLTNPAFECGRPAVMVLDAAQTHLLVFTTGDGGASWSGPGVLGEPGGKRYLPWIAYGPTGALGAVWRSAADDGSYAAWAAVAPRGDTRFAPPVRLSGAPSPGPVSQLAGDDASDVALDSRELHAVWGDRRGGQLGVWYGRYRWAADPAVRVLNGTP
jgi:hypothetical protein